MSGMKPGVPMSVEEYITVQPEATRPKARTLRAAIKKSVPEAAEDIGYRIPQVCSVSPGARRPPECAVRMAIRLPVDAGDNGGKCAQ
jgi:hypothetical protein